jgi:DNA recombination protein Rad52
MASHPIVTSTSQDNVTDANPTEEAESVSGRAPEPASCFFPIPTALTPVHSALASTSMVEPDALPQVSLPGDHLPQVPQKPILWVYNAADGSVMTDKHGRPVSVGKLLATKPLRHEILTRPGPGGKKLYYMSGEGITRTLNDIFGFDGWDLNISRVQREEVIKEDKTGKFTVCYTAQVRLTHKLSGAYREDCGAGDAQDRSFGTAVANAMKASITDALKRAARHFGDKCGNCMCRIVVYKLDLAISTLNSFFYVMLEFV